MKIRKPTPSRPTQHHADPFIGGWQWEKWKREAAKPQEGADGFAVLNLAGKRTRQQYLEAMLEMEEKYPGRGWREQMDELEAFYHKHNLPLKDYPRMKTIGDPPISPDVEALLKNPPF